MKKAMLLYATGEEHGEMHRLTLPGKRAYADRHGYIALEAKIELGDRHPAWEKVPIMADLLDNYDAVLFLGADVWIANGAIDLAANVPPEAWQALVVHDIDRMHEVPHVGHVPNTDVWLVQRAMQPVLRTIDSMSEQLRGHSWWEQAANMLLMGFGLDTPCIRRKESDLWAHTYELDGRWNQHPFSKCLGAPYFKHATGFGIPERLKMLRAWVNP